MYGTSTPLPAALPFAPGLPPQVFVDQPSVAVTISILRGLRPHYERHHGVAVGEDALVAAAQLSARYIAGRFLPDKAIDLMDEATAQVGRGAGARKGAVEGPWRGRGGAVEGPWRGRGGAVEGP